VRFLQYRRKVIALFSFFGLFNAQSFLVIGKGGAPMKAAKTFYTWVRGVHKFTTIYSFILYVQRNAVFLNNVKKCFVCTPCILNKKN